MLVFEIFYFFLLIFFVLFLPGNFLLKIFKFSNKDFIIRSSLSFGLGISLFMLGMYGLSWFKIEFIYNLFILILPLFYLKELENIKLGSFKNFPIFQALIIFIGSIFASFLMWKSGSIENGSMIFFGVNSTDAIYHLSLIGNLKSNFPPTHPGILDLPLRGYNFFYDLMLANFSKFYRLEVMDLYFKFFPIFISAFYGLSGWALGRFMKMKTVTIIIFLFLLYFTQGLSKTIPIGKITNYDPGIVHTIANIVDPSVILSVSLLFILFILIFSDRKRFLFFLPILILSTLPMIKIYTGLLAFISVGAVFFSEALKKRDFYFFKILIPGALIAALTYVPTNFGSGRLIYAPGLLYRHYLESISAENNLDWYLRLLVFEQYKNIPQTILYKYVLVLPLFFLPSLGLRAVNLFFVKKLFNKKFYSTENLFWISAIVVGFLIPSFFIQSIAVFVVIQFLWIAFFILLIPTSYSLTNILGKVTWPKTVILTIIMIAIIFSENLALFKLYSEDPVKVDIDLINTSTEISKIPNDQGLIILNVEKIGEAYQPMYIFPFFSAFSEKSVYFEPELMEFSNIDKEVLLRKKEVGDLKTLLVDCSNQFEIENKIDLFRNQGISYILDLNNSNCFDKLKDIKLIYQNSHHSLYKSL